MSAGGVATTGARLLLRRLRSLMAEGGSAEQRLQQIVRTIAADMVAEVCSAYVMRPGEVLELFATEGLKAEAIHRTRLRVGEGLVGDIASHARPLALADAQAHPNFAYRPETGEEIYKSLMGVPILRGGRVIGVLVVQNRKARNYSEEEIEALETTAMVLAELVASGELVPRSETRPTEGIGLLPMRLEGVVLCAGLAIGRAVLHKPRPTLMEIVAENPASERERLHFALTGLSRSLEDLLARDDFASDGEPRDILEAYRMFAQDRGWRERLNEAITGGLTAEGAVLKVQNDAKARMAQVVDPYLRERLADFDNMADRLLRHLTGEAATLALPEKAVLIARNLGPAELLEFERKKLRAVVLEEGSSTAHVAIVARALDLPVLGRVEGALTRIEAGDRLIVDADNGQLFVRPGEDIEEKVQESMVLKAQRRASFASQRDLPAVSRDGVAISLSINAGLLIDMQHLEPSGAEGVGLYRTEIAFMVRDSFPDVGQQTEFYRRIYDQAGERPIVFRTLDVGGDKVLPYWPREGEENPALGWRALRIGLDLPNLLRQQLRAMIAAAADRPLRIMFPMIAMTDELRAARALVDLELSRASERGQRLPAKLELGAMLEVPSLLWQLPELLRLADFISVGSNDLAQFLFASDRGNPRLAGRYDSLSPAMLSVIAQLVARCAEAGRPISVCGEMAGQPLEAMALLGLGLYRLSMAPSAIGPVKTMLRSLDIGQLQSYLAARVAQGHGGLRRDLLAYAKDHGVAL
ncbi:MAG TPA: phosphoenolpyruvate--protein phosphotransferase [Candidatus Polarisedimenticolia bacterium]|nr:phosphoenolpyruvate--protein phosphotransferase [Candidatus Polarisedimenticolia bacterium]